MKTIRFLGAFLTIASVSGCSASLPPPELIAARQIYQRASLGPAAQVNPTDLHLARESLDTAEGAFQRDGDTQDTRDLGYTAERRAELAESRARGMLATQQMDRTIAQMHANTADQAKASSAQLGKANQAIASQNQALATQGAQLQTEVQRRKDAEARAAAATAALAKFAQVKQEPRGIVITLSGSVLFTSGKADLLPAAQLKLNDVAEALTQQDPESKMVVEGHTDSQGTLASNQDLSVRRAQAVRDYLVSRGISADRISFKGFGPTQAIATNATPEGRANNRRVEIVVQPIP